MDPEELYRLIERQQELLVHHDKINPLHQLEEQDQQQEIDPLDVYQYLKINQPINSVVEVSCALDEAPDVPTLPSSTNIVAITTLVFLLIFILFFLRQKFCRQLKWNEITTNNFHSLININYSKDIWTHPESMIALLSHLIQIIDSSTQRLYYCNNHFEIISLSQLHQHIIQINQLFLSLQSSFVKDPSLSSDLEEQLFIRRYSNQLDQLRNQFIKSQQIVEKFILIQHNLIYELNTARMNKNVSE
jgi:hypothetical protein